MPNMPGRAEKTFSVKYDTLPTNHKLHTPFLCMLPKSTKLLKSCKYIIIIICVPAIVAFSISMCVHMHMRTH